jgi:hypothetical protein
LDGGLLLGGLRLFGLGFVLGDLRLRGVQTGENAEGPRVRLAVRGGQAVQQLVAAEAQATGQAFDVVRDFGREAVIGVELLRRFLPRGCSCLFARSAGLLGLGLDALGEFTARRLQLAPLGHRNGRGVGAVVRGVLLPVHLGVLLKLRVDRLQRRPVLQGLFGQFRLLLGLGEPGFHSAALFRDFLGLAGVVLLAKDALSELLGQHLRKLVLGPLVLDLLAVVFGLTLDGVAVLVQLLIAFRGLSLSGDSLGLGGDALLLGNRVGRFFRHELSCGLAVR